MMSHAVRPATPWILKLKSVAQALRWRAAIKIAGCVALTGKELSKRLRHGMGCREKSRQFANKIGKWLNFYEAVHIIGQPLLFKKKKLMFS